MTEDTGLSFVEFSKIPRLNRNCVVTEKIDGTNAQIFIGENGEFLTGSRNRYVTPDNDNYGFARWAEANREELLLLGPGRHFGEWWGSGIQRGYGLTGGDKRFSLFNVGRWKDQPLPSCVGLVPVLYEGPFRTETIAAVLENLKTSGSVAAPGFTRPEGVIVYHVAAGSLFKATVEKDESPKGLVL